MLLIIKITLIYGVKITTEVVLSLGYMTLADCWRSCLVSLVYFLPKFVINLFGFKTFSNLSVPDDDYTAHTSMKVIPHTRR
jgi:hypothetical protein